MAELTSYQMEIPRPQHGAVEPQSTTSPITGILGGADSALQGWDSLKYNQRLDDQAEKNQALSEVAGKTFGLLVNTNDKMVPTSTVDGINTLNKVSNAVNQGSMPKTALPLQMQQIFSTEIANHPDQAANIVAYARENGYNHIMFDNIDQAQKAQDAESSTVVAAKDTAARYAYSNGVSYDTPYDQAAVTGQQLQAAHALQTQSASMLEQAQKTATFDTTQAKAQREQANTVGLQGVLGEMNARVTPIYQTISTQITSALSDPSKTSQVQNTVLPLLDNMNAAALSSAYKHLNDMGIATPENMKAAKDNLDAITGGFKSIFTDQTGGLQRTVQNLQNQYHLDVAKAAPIIYKLGSLVGNNQVAALLGTASTLNPELQKQLAAEWQGVATTGSTDGQVHLNNIVSILKGNTNLKDYSEADAAKYIGGIVTAKGSSEAAIINSRGTGVDATVYLNSQSNVINAVHSLTPASTFNDLKNASTIAFNQGTRLALDKLAANPDTAEQAEAVGMASHVSAVKMVQDLKQKKDDPNEHGGFGLGLSTDAKGSTIQYNPSSGVFEVKIAPGSGVARAPQYQLDRVALMNNTLDHAVKTSKYDTDIPKSATPLQLRNWIANNVPPPGSKEDAPRQSAEAAWQQSETNLETTLRSLPGKFVGQDATRSSVTGADMDPKDRPVNNPLNLRASPTSFQQFSTLDEGIKKADDNLSIYGSKHGIDTVSGIVSRWAPKADHNDTDKYAAAVAADSGYDLNEKVDLTDPHVRAVILSAMSRQEGNPLPVGRISKVTAQKVASE